MNKEISGTTKLVLCGLAIALNIVLGIVTAALKFPFYLDVMGTIFIAIYLVRDSAKPWFLFYEQPVYFSIHFAINSFNILLQIRYETATQPDIRSSQFCFIQRQP